MLKSKAIVLVGALAVSGTASADLNTGLMAYWSFDDCTAKDNSGNGHDGSQIGTTCSNGTIKKSLTFNGSTDYVEVPNTPELSPTSAITVSAWVKLNGFYMDGCKNSSIVYKGNDGHVGFFGLALTDPVIWTSGCSADSGKHVFNFGVDFSDSSMTGVVGTQDILLGNWYLATATYDGSDMKLYVNGKLETQKYFGKNLGVNSQNLTIGRMNLSWAPYWVNGGIDDVRIYNRALTPAEVTALYQKGAVSQGNPVYNSLTDIAQKIIDNRIEEAVSAIPNMVGFLANHDYFKNTTIFKIGINGKIGTQLQKQIREKLPSLDVSHMAKDVALDLLVDFIINETTAAVDRATNHNKYYVGATWFLMKEMYALGDAYSTSKKGIPFPVAFLSSQSSFLIEVVYKDIKEFNILQKDFTGAKASEIRGEIIRARGLDLLQFYQEYFRAETQEEKAIILNDIATRQKELLSAYFSGDNIFLPRVSKIAKTVYADWLKHLPGKLVKDEFEGRVRLHTLVYYQSDYDTAIKAATFIYGTPIVAIDLIREKAQTDEGANNYLIEHGY